MVNLEWYRSFIAIYKMGTLTKAAESLYTSQPGISLHLNALESYTGKKLFERTSRRMISYRARQATIQSYYRRHRAPGKS